MVFEFTDSNFEETALNGVVFVDFWATWCGPCRLIDPIIDELASEYKNKALVGRLDVDNNPEVPLKYHVTGIPFILILRDGKVVDGMKGAQTKEFFATRLDSHL